MELTELNSSLYECSVMHHRFAPKEHHMQHAIFMFYLDLDELDAVAKKVFLFSHNRKSFYNFRDNDHEPSGANPLKARVIDFLSRTGIQFDPHGRIMLLTLPRVLGYIFNPISIYFCFDQSGVAVCSVVEVGNTFREMKLFLLKPDHLHDDKFSHRTPKHFYVSPFSSLELNFDFNLKIPGNNLDIRIDDYDGENKVLISTLTGHRAPLTNKKLFWFTFKYPLVTLKVIFLIHWHAFRLWIKRVPFYRKAANPALQNDVLRPHSTLTAKPK